MIRIISISLLLSLSFQFLFKAGIAGYYLANKDYIASVLCINKDNKALHCDGKCYLIQKMQAADDKTHESAISLKYEPVEFLTETDTNAILLCGNISRKIKNDYHNSYHLIAYKNIFQPPRF